MLNSARLYRIISRPSWAARELGCSIGPRQPKQRCPLLVQIALQAAGIACPRDTYMQEAALGVAVPVSDLKRGDLIFWKGHVAIARDADTIIHANAHHMQVAIEPAQEALARIKAAGSDVTSIKRIS